jgi:transcription initiation factor TFIID subunit TAF12
MMRVTKLNHKLMYLQILLDIADEFVDEVAAGSCQLAKLRGSSTVDLRDVQVIIEVYNRRV